MARHADGALQHTPEELEFFAEDEEVTVTPHFTLNTHESKLRCVAGDYGPFKANFPVKVPLWLAVYLYQRKQCRIQLPDWLTSEHLQEVFQAEKQTSSVFQELPWHYLEIAHVLLTSAKDCFPSVKEHMEVRDLTDQIRRVRDSKINQGLELVTGPLTAKLNNLCCMELNTLRPFFLGSLDRFWRMSQMTEVPGTDDGGRIGDDGDDGSGGDDEAGGPSRQSRRQLNPG